MAELTRVVSVGIIVVVVLPVTTGCGDESKHQHSQQSNDFHFSSFLESSDLSGDEFTFFFASCL
jgi:hypothetical protein